MNTTSDTNGTVTFDHSVHSEQGARVALLVDEVLRLHGRVVSAKKPSALGSSAQAIVLASVVLAQDPPTVARIARSLGYSRQAVQRVADVLVENGHVLYQDNPHHKTSRQLEATEQGKQAYAEANRESAQWTERVSAGLSAQELEQALSVLRRIRRNLETDKQASAGGPA
ncbi:winged helix-turn-helix transcriptional regulator [Pseudomonas capeferrum]|uniref:MarR family winged helix-turn-helix transcriptional regulator n=1 Tax=Pseudomonas capeferrum TaxID=1495066 RepID=UPI0015E41B97|nr:MarR family winged helix-turn-helix transcriptional regulator [Pseudomonas capeferrum]MBA1204280.1 winged helix-turn-helix transcriptional regulator [Pseudomonas capeferrum]